MEYNDHQVSKENQKSQSLEMNQKNKIKMPNTKYDIMKSEYNK